MSASRFEGFLAKLYVDESARAKFLADPCGEAVKAGLTPQEVRLSRGLIAWGCFTTSLERKRQGRFWGTQDHF